MAVSALGKMIWAMVAVLAAFSGVRAQDVSPQNNTANLMNNVLFNMATMINNMAVHVTVAPLTNNAGLSGSLSQLQAIQPSGPLLLTTGTNDNSVQPGDICYVSCEASDYTTNIGSQRSLQLAVSQQPAAVVLYSTYAASCSFQATGGFIYSSIYTMVDANSSLAIANGLKSGSPQNPKAAISLNQTSVNNGGGSGDPLGKSPTTAVAMIILYSITGIITALFLLIIVVGAIRAHRHPERYGPRHVVGRPRQSRAKGIARAMLETLPIVKFGDQENDEVKPAGRTGDLEMADTSAATNESTSTDPETHPANSADHEHVKTQAAVDTAGKTRAVDGDEDGLQPVNGEPGSSETAAATSANPIDDGLACSVCTDDFIKGQDIRLLPCKHKFHPECIDPWLLNVSGTCPLCRIDLRPVASHEGVTDGTESMPEASLEARHEADMPPGTVPTESRQRNRRSRILSTLNIGRMRHATPQERIEALRALRHQGIAHDSVPNSPAVTAGASTPSSTPNPERTRDRFGRRFSRALGSRPSSGVQSSRPVSEAPTTATAPAPAPTTTADSPTITTNASTPAQQHPAPSS